MPCDRGPDDSAADDHHLRGVDVAGNSSGDSNSAFLSSESGGAVPAWRALEVCYVTPTQVCPGYRQFARDGLGHRPEPCGATRSDRPPTLTRSIPECPKLVCLTQSWRAPSAGGDWDRRHREARRVCSDTRAPALASWDLRSPDRAAGGFGRRAKMSNRLWQCRIREKQPRGLPRADCRRCPLETRHACVRCFAQPGRRHRHRWRALGFGASSSPPRWGRCDLSSPHIETNDLPNSDAKRCQGHMPSCVIRGYWREGAHKTENTKK